MYNYLPYLFIFFLILSADLKFETVSKGKIYSYGTEQKIFLYFLLIIFFGCRGFISTDWVNYYKHFQMFDEKKYINNLPQSFILNNSLGYEKFFVFCLAITKLLFHNYFVFQAINTTVDVIVLYSFFKKFNYKHIPLCFAFYLIFAGFGFEINLLRNSKALMLFLISLRYLSEKKTKSYFLINLLGLLFHASSIIYIIIFPLFFIRWTKLKSIIFYITGLLFYLLQIPLLSRLLQIVLNLTLSGRYAVLVNQYLLGDDLARGISIGFIQRALTFIIFMIYKEKLIKQNYYKYFYQIYYIYFFLYFYCCDIAIIPERCGPLFAVSYWIIYPGIYQLLSKRNKSLFLILFILYSILLIKQSYSPSIFRYSFCFSEINTYQKKASLLFKYLKGQ